MTFQLLIAVVAAVLGSIAVRNSLAASRDHDAPDTREIAPPK